MERSSIDRPGNRPNTTYVELRPYDRTPLGGKLRRLREEQGWKQKDVAEKLGVSVGTVQSAETPKETNVQRETLERYAGLFQTTVEKILHPELSGIPSTDPLVRDLNRDHLLLANRYMRALDDSRAAVKILLGPTDTLYLETFAQIVIALERLVHQLPQIGDATLRVLDFPDLVVVIARGLDQDPTFEQRLRDL